jgi:hypothetical protein
MRQLVRTPNTNSTTTPETTRNRSGQAKSVFSLSNRVHSTAQNHRRSFDDFLEERAQLPSVTFPIGLQFHSEHLAGQII